MNGYASTPALDKKGKPIASQGTRRVNWQMPEHTGKPLANLPERTVIQYDVDENGGWSNCSVVELQLGKNTPLSGTAAHLCNTINGHKALPYTDGSGQPVNLRVQMTTEFKQIPMKE